MWVVHQEMARIWANTKQRELTKDEMTELHHCLDANMHKCRKVATLKNLSLVASMTGDHDWQHDICAKLDKIYAEFK
jgi:hypothetical protein